MMDIREYAKTLLKLKGQDLSVPKLLGARWIVLKIVLVLVGIFALLDAHMIAKGFGIFVFGYVFGVAVANIRSQVLAKRRWPLQQQLLDWTKIESTAKQECDGFTS